MCTLYAAKSQLNMHIIFVYLHFECAPNCVHKVHSYLRLASTQSRVPKRCHVYLPIICSLLQVLPTVAPQHSHAEKWSPWTIVCCQSIFFYYVVTLNHSDLLGLHSWSRVRLGSGRFSPRLGHSCDFHTCCSPLKGSATTGLNVPL